MGWFTDNLTKCSALHLVSLLQTEISNLQKRFKRHEEASVNMCLRLIVSQKTWRKHHSAILLRACITTFSSQHTNKVLLLQGCNMFPSLNYAYFLRLFPLNCHFYLPWRENDSFGFVCMDIYTRSHASPPNALIQQHSKDQSNGESKQQQTAKTEAQLTKAASLLHRLHRNR